MISSLFPETSFSKSLRVLTLLYQVLCIWKTNAGDFLYIGHEMLCTTDTFISIPASLSYQNEMNRTQVTDNCFVMRSDVSLLGGVDGVETFLHFVSPNKNSSLPLTSLLDVLRKFRCIVTGSLPRQRKSLTIWQIDHAIPTFDYLHTSNLLLCPHRGVFVLVMGNQPTLQTTVQILRPWMPPCEIFRRGYLVSFRHHPLSLDLGF